MEIYRIFNALGDSIILATYIKQNDVKEITFNRAETDTLNIVLDMYGIERPKYKKSLGSLIEKRMPHYVSEMHKSKVPLLSFPVEMKSAGYMTYQLTSKNESAKDRTAKLSDMEDKGYTDKRDTREATDLKSLTELLSGSEYHWSIDSGTAWLAAAMGIPTNVYSKNSYYFADAYHYMKYLNWHKNVKVKQMYNDGVKMPSSLDYYTSASENGVTVSNFSDFQRLVQL